MTCFKNLGALLMGLDVCERAALSKQAGDGPELFNVRSYFFIYLSINNVQNQVIGITYSWLVY